MNDFIRITTGLIIAAFGVLILVNSANMSFQGYEQHFEDLTGAGLIGVGIAGLAFFCAAAIGVAARAGMKDVATIAAVMAAVCFCGDVYGNHLATGGEVEAERVEALQGVAAFDEASIAIVATRSRAAAIRSELATIAGTDIKATQRLLKAKGLYAGRIDGFPGGLTEKAMSDFGGDLRTELAKLDAAEALQSAIVSRGAPELPGETEGAFALAVAFLLSALSMAASAIGIPLMFGKAPDGEEELAELESTMDAFEAEVFDFGAWLEGKEAV